MKSKTVQLYLVVTIAFLALIFNSCASSRPNTRSGPTRGPLDSVQRQADGKSAAKRPGLFSTSVTDEPSHSGNGAGESGVATLEESTDKETAIEESDNPGTPELTAPEKSVQKILDEALNYCEVSQQFWQKGELDNALEALDQAYALILDVDTSDQPKLIQQKEDLRFLISKRILEIYASRNIVVNGNHNAIPMVINRFVQAEIDNFTTGSEHTFFVESYRRSGRYRPKIVASLHEAGLPTELSWLPLIESGFKVNALSKARALGLWQFIPSTGYKFGLSRDKYIDERLDPDKATAGAIAYLKELHQIFGDWTTVLAAYNCGEGRVLRVIREQNVNYLDNFWDLYERLPYETARYVPRFLATLYIIENKDRYGLNDIQLDSPSEYEEIEITRQVHLKNVAVSIGVTEVQMSALNPELRYKIAPPDKYLLKVPAGTGDVLTAKLDSIPESKPPTRAVVYHRVRRGETLSTIARKYRVHVNSIMRANNLRRSNYIVAGRLLKIPMAGYRYQAAITSGTTVAAAETHKVARGDNLWNIAKRYGTTTNKIQEINNLRSTKLYTGQVLKLPGSGQSRTADSSAGHSYRVYSVQAGDSAFAIAQQHKMNLDRLLDINQLSSASKIFPGQQLYIE
ncbi:MAG: LysM peptidoglycan-binding domain-containing protein [Desulfobacterales bacterium]